MYNKLLKHLEGYQTTLTQIAAECKVSEATAYKVLRGQRSCREPRGIAIFAALAKLFTHDPGATDTLLRLQAGLMRKGSDHNDESKD